MASRDDEEQWQRPPSRWGSHAAQAPSGYSGPSGTGYGQTCPGQSGYGQTERENSQPASGVSYAGTVGYAGYASARHTSARGPGDAQRQHPDWDDIDYLQWRDAQLRKLDTDYETWRQARYRKFADEFDAWRATRQNSASVAPPTDPTRAVDALSHPSSFQPQ